MRTDAVNLWLPAMGYILALMEENVAESGWDKFQQNISLFYNKRCMNSFFMLLKLVSWDFAKEYRGRRTVHEYNFEGVEVFQVEGGRVFGRLEELLAELSLQLATDLRDKIYGILGISSDFSEGGIVPNYAMPG